MPSNYQIFDYWKDKKLPGGICVLWDYGEPSCWGCSLPIHVETPELLKKGDFKTIWNKTSGYLERCHIIPRSLGGSNDPSNLFLLCSECHIQSPDTDNPEIFMKWIAHRRQNSIGGVNYQDVINAVKDACVIYKIDFDEFSKFIISHDQKKLPVNVTTHGFEFSPSTLIMALAQEFVDSKQKAVV